MTVLESDSATAFGARQRTGLWLAPLVFLLVWFLPLNGLSMQAHRLAAVIGFTVVLWVTEAIPLAASALLGPALCILLGVSEAKENPAKDVLKSFGDPIVFVFIGGFLLAEGISRHGLDRRIAFRVLGMPWVSRGPMRVLVAFAAVTGGLSMWISNTATTAMMFPIGLSILREMSRLHAAQSGQPCKPIDLPVATGMMLMASFASSVGGIATPVGTPPNLVGLGLIQKHLGLTIPFFQWMMIGTPLALLLIAFLCLQLGRAYPANVETMSCAADWIRKERANLGALGRGEANVLVAFILTVLLWITPGIMAAVLGPRDPATMLVNRHLPESAAALIGASLLFLLPLDFGRGRFTLTWEDAKRIDWGTVLLFGGGLALGDLMFTTGLAKWIGDSLASMLHAKSVLGLTILFTLLAVVVSETCSNVASATMVVPVAIAVAQGAGLEPLQPALAACLGSSLGFMLPVSTPPNAIVYSSGCISITKMIRHGILLDLIGSALVILLVSTLVPVVMGR